jgi:hypothetical protein
MELENKRYSKVDLDVGFNVGFSVVWKRRVRQCVVTNESFQLKPLNIKGKEDERT